MSNNIICRKCGGNHFTTKCGREQELSNKNISITFNNRDNIRYNKDNKDNRDNRDNNNIYNRDNRYNYDKEEIYRLQISNLPLNMTNSEMKELLNGWGNINKIKVINYEETSVAYIDFKYKEQSEYFINALDKTIFDNMIVYVNSVKSY
jgi:hypothetical protein